MFNSVQYVREVCQQRKIPISQLEKDCGFSNGYLNPKKMSKIPYERAKVIADYLGITVESILDGDAIKNTPTDTSRRDVSDEDIMFALFGGSGEITDEMYEEVKNFARFIAQREEAKKNRKEG